MTTDEIIKRGVAAGIQIETDWAGRPSTLVIKDGGMYLRVADEIVRFATLVRNAALEEAIKIIEEYRIPVGNSAAGELACEWTRDALEEIRDMLRAIKEQAWPTSLKTLPH